MAIAVATSRQVLADAYKGLGQFFGACTGDPGNAAAPLNEAAGGTPAYIRKAGAWVSGTGGVLTNSPVILDVPTGNYNFILLASTASGATMADKAAVTAVNMTTQGQLVVTAGYGQT